MFRLPLYLRKLLFPFLFLLPTLFVSAQVLDTARVIREVDSLIQVSRELTGKREFEKALAVNDAAEKIALEKFGRESDAYGNCCCSRGRLLYSRGDFSDAKKWLKECNTIKGLVLGKRHSEYAASLNALAIACKSLGELENAEGYLIEAITIVEVQNIKNTQYAAYLSNLGNLYRAMYKFEKAMPLLIEAKAIQEIQPGKMHSDYTNTLNNLAILYAEIGNFKQAELLLLDIKSIREKIWKKNHPDFSSSFINLASIYLSLGLYEKAEHLLLEAKVILETELGTPDLIRSKNYLKLLNNLAIVYWRIKDYEKAEALFIELIEIREKEGKRHRDYATALFNLANLYFDLGRFSEVEQLYIEAKTIKDEILGNKHPKYAQILNNTGKFYWKTGNYKQAESLFIEAIIIYEETFGKEHPEYIRVLNNLGQFYMDSNNYEKAEIFISESGRLNKSLQIEGLHYLSELEMSRNLSAFSQWQEETLSLVHRAYYSNKARTGIPLICYDNTLFYKGFLLTAANQIKQLALSDSATTEKFNLLKSYQRRLAAEYAKPIAERKNVAELEEKANEIEKDLARSVAGYGEAMRQVKWQEVQQVLRPGEAAIEFVHYRYYDKKETDSIMYAALLLRPGDEQPFFVPLCEARQLQSHIEAQRLKSINNLYAYFGEGSPSLYTLLWSSLEPYLKGVNTIYYSPSGELHRFNLAAVGLPSGVLDDRYRLQLLMSTRQLVSPAQPPSAKKGEALVFGGIRYDVDSTAIYKANEKFGALTKDATGGYLDYVDRTRGDFKGMWGYLEGTKQEADSIRMTLEDAGFAVMLRQGEEATEEVFKQTGRYGGRNIASPTILHIATHGYFFPDPTQQPTKGGVDNEPVFKMSEHPLIRSGLILAGANHAWSTGRPYTGAEDGILTAYEVSQMDLSNTELVVLSACETGLGDIQGNEGVYGLQRAFRIAGAKYLLMSLWNVPDEATRQLMTGFYRYWLTDKMPLEDAFRKAQVELRIQNSDPEVWAGFVLIKG
jgi:CHAT domain-containing protein/Flp pilus assembly protein TadD